MNPDVTVKVFKERLTSDNVDRILGEGWDVIVDGADNFPTRYLPNDASVWHGIPVVHGSIFRFEGQVTVFKPKEGPCYRCLFPQPPPPELAPSCAEGGVLGVLPGIVGSLQANEALKLALGIGDPLVGWLQDAADALRHLHRSLSAAIRIGPVCGDVGEQIRRRRDGVAPVQQLEAGAALQQRNVVDQSSAGRRVDEGVLEQPEDPTVGKGERPLIVGAGERQLAAQDFGEGARRVGVDADMGAEVGAGLTDRGLDEAAFRGW